MSLSRALAGEAVAGLGLAHDTVAKGLREAGVAGRAETLELAANLRAVPRVMAKLLLALDCRAWGVGRPRDERLPLNHLAEIAIASTPKLGERVIRIEERKDNIEVTLLP